MKVKRILGTLAVAASMFVMSSGMVLAAYPDGIIDAGEDCDDNNAVNGDGCQSPGFIEGGWRCSGAPSSCVRGIGMSRGTTALGTATSEIAVATMTYSVSLAGLSALIGGVGYVLHLALKRAKVSGKGAGTAAK